MTTTLRNISLAALAAGLAACTAQAPPTPEASSRADILYDGPIDALAPFRHGNSYTYTVAGSEQAERQIESRCSVAGSRVFLIVSEEAEVLARTEMVLDETTLYIVSEVSPRHDFAFTYDPPLAVLSTPLRAGVQRTHANINAWRPSDGTSLGSGTVEVTWSAHRAPAEMTDASLEIRTVKRMAMDSGHQSRLQSKRWLAVGVGEISSSGTSGDGRKEFRELQCARIGERAFGPCGEPILRNDR